MPTQIARLPRLLVLCCAGLAVRAADPAPPQNPAPNARVRFTFTTKDVRDQESKVVGEPTETCITRQLRDLLNSELQDSPKKYWRFTEGDNGLILSAKSDGWVKLTVTAAGPTDATPSKDEPFDESIVPLGCRAWNSQLVPALRRLINKNNGADILKILQAIPVANELKRDGNLAEIVLPADSGVDLQFRRFSINLAGRIVTACGTGATVTLGAKLRLLVALPNLHDLVKMGEPNAQECTSTRRSQAVPVKAN